MTGTALTEIAARLLDLLEAEAEACGVPGVAVGVAHGADRVHVVHGVTSTENPLPVTDHTLFAIGSVTKTYTATALMRLVEQGRVDLDAPLRTYLPDLQLKDADAAERVTPRHLLNHTAGWDGGDSVRPSNPGPDALPAFVRELASYEQLTAPGVVASYNNAAFAVAGCVLEAVTGQSYEKAVADLVLTPLGLRESYFDLADVVTRRFAVGHGSKGSNDGGTQVIHLWDTDRSMAPAGGLMCSIVDLVSYGVFHVGDGQAPDGTRLLDPKTLATMQQPSTALPLDDAHVGVSWFLRERSGVRTVGHTGGTLAGAAVLDLVPQRGLVLAITVNSIAAGSMRLIERVRTIVLDEHLGLPATDLPAADLSAHELAAYTGRYDRGGGSVLEVGAAEGGLVAFQPHTDEAVAMFQQLRPGEPVPVPARTLLVPLGDDRFARSDREHRTVDATFLRLDGPEVDGVRWSGRVARRIS